MIDIQLIIIHAFTGGILISLLVDEILLPRFSNLIDKPLKVEMVPVMKKYFTSEKNILKIYLENPPEITDKSTEKKIEWHTPFW